MTTRMTMTQKILAAHAGLPSVKAGDLIEAKLDMVLGNDITSPVAIDVFDKAGFTRVLIKKKSLWFWTTIHHARTSSLHSYARRSENLPSALT